MSKITDPAVLAAMDFIDQHYATRGTRAPADGSREEQHAISVLAAYIRARLASTHSPREAGRGETLQS